MYGENMYGEGGYGQNAGEGTGQFCPGAGEASGQPYADAGQVSGQPYVNAGPAAGPFCPGGAPVPMRVQTVAGPRYSAKLETIMDRFRLYGVGSIVYGILFTICLYPGFCGISVPALSFFTMGCLFFLFQDMKIETGKSVWFYFVCWGLLSVSSCLTGSRVIITFNTIGMLLLFLGLMLSRFCNTKTWGFGTYILQICKAPFVAMGCLPCFFRSFNRFLSREKEGGLSKGKYIWLGAGLSVPVVLIAVCLLASADAVFEQLCDTILEAIKFPAHPFWMVLLLSAGILGSYALLAYFVENEDRRTVKEEKKKWEPMIGIAFLLVLTIVYIVFSGIQISCLFFGRFALSDGYTYASYAREGFFQLLLVCLMNLVILLTCVSWFREHGVLKLLLTIFSVCTLIMDASSAMRMMLYVQAYQLTFMRVLVLWALVVIAILLAGCIVTVYNPCFPLFRYGMAVVTVCYLIFSLAKPDYMIAKYNVAYASDELDVSYLCSLSSDAIPVLEEAGLLDPQAWEYGYLNRYYLRMKLSCYREMGIRSFNLSDYTAGKILEKYEDELSQG